MRFGRNGERPEQKAYQLLTARQEEIRHEADEERTHHRADTHRAAKQPADGDKGEVADDTHDAELFMELVADDKTDKIVRTRAGVGLDDGAHAERQNDAAGGQNGQLQPEVRDVRCKRRRKKRGKEVNDRPAADHADDRTGHDVRAVDEQKRNNDDQAQRNMRAAVGEKRPAGEFLQRVEHALHQHVERVGAEIRQQKQRHAEMRNCETDEQNHEPRQQLFDGILQHIVLLFHAAPQLLLMIAYSAHIYNL